MLFCLGHIPPFILFNYAPPRPHRFSMRICLNATFQSDKWPNGISPCSPPSNHPDTFNRKDAICNSCLTGKWTEMAGGGKGEKLIPLYYQASTPSKLCKLNFPPLHPLGVLNKHASYGERRLEDRSHTHPGGRVSTFQRLL